jgi:hypothetical protein
MVIYAIILKSPRRGVEKLASRKAHNLETGGSSPPPATKKLESDRLHSLLSGTCKVFSLLLAESMRQGIMAE